MHFNIILLNFFVKHYLAAKAFCLQSEVISISA